MWRAALDRDITGDGVVSTTVGHPTAAGYRRIGDRFHAFAFASDNGPFSTGTPPT